MSKLLTESEVFPNIERTLGGKIVSSRRQGGRDAGGRPCWFIELRKGESVTPYYIRGDRGGDFGYIKEYGLQREARILQVLHAEGIPVPAVVATCDDPSFLVMEMVDGEADISTVSDAAEMDRIARHFAKVMADWHSIPVERFASVGLHVPLTSEELIGRDLDAWESGYHAMISQPVPLVTFACRWLRRNARRVDACIQRLEQKLGRPPEEREIAEALGMESGEYRQLLGDINSGQLLPFEELVAEGVEPVADTAAESPLDIFLDTQQRSRLMEAIDQLPERERLLMALYYQEELNLKEIGAVLGVSESRVCQLHSQAVSRLRARLAD